MTWKPVILSAAAAVDVATWTTEIDGDGAPLLGVHPYRLRFLREPPARGYWTILIHDVNCLPVDNALRRFSISDRQTLEFNDDGSLDVYIGYARPARHREVNWLPAPPADFHLILNIYGPLPDVLSREWQPPDIVRLDIDSELPVVLQTEGSHAAPESFE